MPFSRIMDKGLGVSAKKFKGFLGKIVASDILSVGF